MEKKRESSQWKGAFNTGVYRNMFAEVGFVEEEIEQRKQEIFQTLFYGDEEERIYFPVGSDMGYIEDTGNYDVRTEGMSYGMMMCVQMDRKEEFDRLWKWARTYMYMEEGENKAILHGHAKQMVRKMHLEQHQTERNSLQCHFFSHRTGGEMEKEYFSMQKKQKNCSIPAFTRAKVKKREGQCGIKIIS